MSKPITRQEALLNSIANGENSQIQPVTREEQYLSYIAGESYSYPPNPITRKEAYLDKIARSGVSGGSGVNVQPLTVTENGTYTALSGTAYSPVNVNVESQGGGDSEADAIIEKTLSGHYSNGRVKTIAESVFYNNKNLTSVDFPNVLSILSSAFDGCTNLVEVKTPKANRINGFGFRSTALRIADFPEVVNLQERAFQGCASLEKAILPKVYDLYVYAFLNCTALTTVIIGTNRDTVCGLKNINAFSNTPIENRTGFIYVPDDLVDAYRTATNWVTYAGQIKGISELNNPTGMVTFTVDDHETVKEYTVADGTTWGEWALTTNGEYTIMDLGDGAVYIEKNGGFITLMDYVISTDIIVAGNYFIG